MGVPSGQQPSGQQQQQQHEWELEIPTEALEAAAVACSGLKAVVERGAQVPSSTWLFAALGGVVQLQNCLADRLRKGMLTPRQLPAALAAAESALRLAAQLVVSRPDLTMPPMIQQAGRPTMVAEDYRGFRLCAVELVKSATGTLRHYGEQSSRCYLATEPDGRHDSEAGSSRQQASIGRPSRDAASLSASELTALGRSAAHLATSAAKLGDPQANPSALAITCFAADDVWLIPVAMLVCEVYSLQSIRCSPEAHDRLIRQLGGVLPPLLNTLAKLNGPNPRLMLLPDSSGSSRLQPTLEKLSNLAELLARLDAMPAGAIAGLQEMLLDVLIDQWTAILDYADAVPLWQADFSRGAGLAAGCIAEHAREGEDLLTMWAEEATSAEGCSSADAKALQGAWQLVEAVSRRVVLEAGDDPATAVAGRTALEVLQNVQQLQPARQRKQQRSPKFWELQVKQELLPALVTLALAAAAKRPSWDELSQELATLRALATRVCASPNCCNIHGCSEGRLRSRRCSECGIARYCCRACQVADFWAHRKVCSLLAAETHPDARV
ncbi:hypothetical protein N2152v2_010537 [Parachlorella kessleri]